MRVLRLDRCSGNLWRKWRKLLFLPADCPFLFSRVNYRRHGVYRLVYWLVHSHYFLLSAKLYEHDVVHWESASCSAHICPAKSAKDITLTPPLVPIDVEQALFSVTDVSFTVPNPHFPSISNSQVSVCTALERPFQGKSDRQRQKSPSPVQRTSYDIAERFRRVLGLQLPV